MFISCAGPFSVAAGTMGMKRNSGGTTPGGKQRGNKRRAHGEGTATTSEYGDIRVDNPRLREYYASVLKADYDATFDILAEPLPAAVRVNRTVPAWRLAEWFCEKVASGDQQIFDEYKATGVAETVPKVSTPESEPSESQTENEKTGEENTLRQHHTLVPRTVVQPARRQDVGINEDSSADKISWLPYTWQFRTLNKVGIKKLPKFKLLKKIMVTEDSRGALVRQELASMIPPLFLASVIARNSPREGSLFLLDMCAAPGSKTSQLVDMVAQLPCRDRTAIIANEIDVKRANTLAHQIHRLSVPNVAVTCSDAAIFPSLQHGSLSFDAILVDVPCSGDGTLRKQPDIWRSWTVSGGLSLHSKQIAILKRGLQLLKKGGRIVYSTCSMNPIENEAVVNAILNQAGLEHVRLVPLSSEIPPGLKARKGLTTWKVPDCNVAMASKTSAGKYLTVFPSELNPRVDSPVRPVRDENASPPLGIQEKTEKIEINEGGMSSPKADADMTALAKAKAACAEAASAAAPLCMYSKFEQVPKNRQAVLRATMFSDDTPKVQRNLLERCLRLYPQDNNTGAFFVAVLEKLIDGDVFSAMTVPKPCEKKLLHVDHQDQTKAKDQLESQLKPRPVTTGRSSTSGTKRSNGRRRQERMTLQKELFHSLTEEKFRELHLQQLVEFFGVPTDNIADPPVAVAGELAATEAITHGHYAWDKVDLRRHVGAHITLWSPYDLVTTSGVATGPTLPTSASAAEPTLTASTSKIVESTTGLNSNIEICVVAKTAESKKLAISMFGPVVAGSSFSPLTQLTYRGCSDRRLFLTSSALSDFIKKCEAADSVPTGCAANAATTEPAFFLDEAAAQKVPKAAGVALQTEASSGAVPEPSAPSRGQAPSSLKVVSCGIRTWIALDVKQTARLEGCHWRLSQEGVLPMLPWLKKRVIFCSLTLGKRLLTGERRISGMELIAAEARGEILNLSTLRESSSDAFSNILPGSVVLMLVPPSIIPLDGLCPAAAMPAHIPNARAPLSKETVMEAGPKTTPAVQQISVSGEAANTEALTKLPTPIESTNMASEFSRFWFEAADFADSIPISAMVTRSGALLSYISKEDADNYLQHFQKSSVQSSQ